MTINPGIGDSGGGLMDGTSVEGLNTEMFRLRRLLGPDSGKAPEP